MPESLFNTALLSGVFAGVVASASTRAIERYGAASGGVLATVPTTAVPATVALASTYLSSSMSSSSSLPSSSSSSSSSATAVQQQPPQYDQFYAAMFSTAVGMLIDAIFLAQWRFWPPFVNTWFTTSGGKSHENKSIDQNRYVRLAVMLLISLSVWFACAVAYVKLTAALSTSTITTISVASFVCHVVLGLLLSYCDILSASDQVNVVDVEHKEEEHDDWQKKHNSSGLDTTTTTTTTTTTNTMLLARGMAAGAANFVCVMLSSYGGVVAGLASVFPAIFTTIMVSLWISNNNSSSKQQHQHNGAASSSNSVAPIMLGSTSVVVYSVSCCWTFPNLGIGQGVVASWIFAVCCASWPVSKWLAYVEREVKRQREENTMLFAK